MFLGLVLSYRDRLFTLRITPKSCSEESCSVVRFAHLVGLVPLWPVATIITSRSMNTTWYQFIKCPQQVEVMPRTPQLWVEKAESPHSLPVDMQRKTSECWFMVLLEGMEGGSSLCYS